MQHPQTSTIKFQPLMPVRKAVTGERIYTRIFQELMTGSSKGDSVTIHHITDVPQQHEYNDDYRAGLGPFYYMMTRMGPTPSDAYSMAERWQRRASVATSFVKWLGTNFGREYLSEVDSFRQHTDDRYYRASAYAMVWAKRITETDGAQRLAIVTEEYAAGQYGLSVPTKFSCDYDDIRVIENLVEWLGVPQGQHFLAKSTRSAKHARSYDDLQEHHRENARRAALGIPIVTETPSQRRRRISRIAAMHKAPAA